MIIVLLKVGLHPIKAVGVLLLCLVILVVALTRRLERDVASRTKLLNVVKFHLAWLWVAAKRIATCHYHVGLVKDVLEKGQTTDVPR